MNLKEIQQDAADKFLEKDRQVGDIFLLSVIAEEVGELAKAVRQKKGTGEEIADVIFSCLSLANLLDVDVEAELVKKYVNKTPSEISASWKDVPWK